ncbi:hypothetical protein ACFWID_16585, partial [Streptomyces sp. NPDC127040]
MDTDRPSTPARAENALHCRFRVISTDEREFTVMPCPNRRSPTSSPQRCHTQLLRQVCTSGPLWSPYADCPSAASRKPCAGFGAGGDGLAGDGEGRTRLGDGDGNGAGAGAGAGRDTAGDGAGDTGAAGFDGGGDFRAASTETRAAVGCATGGSGSGSDGAGAGESGTTGAAAPGEGCARARGSASSPVSANTTPAGAAAPI